MDLTAKAKKQNRYNAKTILGAYYEPIIRYFHFLFNKGVLDADTRIVFQSRRGFYLYMIGLVLDIIPEIGIEPQIVFSDRIVVKKTDPAIFANKKVIISDDSLFRGLQLKSLYNKLCDKDIGCENVSVVVLYMHSSFEDLEDFNYKLKAINVIGTTELRAFSVALMDIIHRLGLSYIVELPHFEILSTSSKILEQLKFSALNPNWQVHRPNDILKRQSRQSFYYNRTANIFKKTHGSVFEIAKISHSIETDGVADAYCVPFKLYTHLNYDLAVKFLLKVLKDDSPYRKWGDSQDSQTCYTSVHRMFVYILSYYIGTVFKKDLAVSSDFSKLELEELDYHKYHFGEGFSEDLAHIKQKTFEKGDTDDTANIIKIYNDVFCDANISSECRDIQNFFRGFESEFDIDHLPEYDHLAPICLKYFHKQKRDEIKACFDDDASNNELLNANEKATKAYRYLAMLCDLIKKHEREYFKKTDKEKSFCFYIDQATDYLEQKLLLVDDIERETVITYALLAVVDDGAASYGTRLIIAPDGKKYIVKVLKPGENSFDFMSLNAYYIAGAIMLYRCFLDIERFKEKLQLYTECFSQFVRDKKSRFNGKSEELLKNLAFAHEIIRLNYMEPDALLELSYMSKENAVSEQTDKALVEVIEDFTMCIAPLLKANDLQEPNQIVDYINSEDYKFW